MAVEDTGVTNWGQSPHPGTPSILSYLAQERPSWTCRHSQVGHREIKSPASSHSRFPAPTSLRSLQESRDAAPGMEPSALQRSLVTLLVSSLP